jgi:hypothetical protein
MAEENITTNIVVNSNFTSLIADLNKVSSSLMNLKEQLNVTNKTLASQISAMNRTFSETLRSTGQFSTHFVSLSSDVDKFGRQLDAGQMKLGQFFRTFNQHTKTSGGLVRDLAKQQVQLQNAILQPLGRNAEGLMQYNVQIPRGLDMIKNKAAIARQELQIMNKVVQEGANSLINWGKNTQWAGRQLTVGLTVPMAAFGKAAADAFNQADQQLVRLTKVYGGLSATSASELLKVRKDVSATAADIAKSYGQAYKDTISLAADIAATGKTGNELLNSTRQTSRLAILGETNVQDAMKATLSIQNTFKQSTDELTQSIDFLNAVENQTSTTMGDLITAIPKAGPVINAMGGSVKDLALMLVAMKEGGIDATTGANALKSALASLINPTKVAVNMFQGFGINLKDIVTKNAGNLTGTILELQGALDKLNPLQKQQAIEQLFGKFQFARMNALFANLGKQGSQTLQVMDLMKASSQDLANIAGRELAQVTESASGKYRRAVEGLKADLASIGEQFLKINTTLINVVDGIIKFTSKLPKPLKDVLGFLGLLTAAAGPLIMLTGVLANFFGYVVKGIFHMKSLFKGGEGWKLLTPEILAANKAAGLVEQTFYSDAKAASILQQALSGLAASYQNVAEKAAMAAVPVAPGVSTVAGNPIIANGRIANPNSPLIGAIDTRAAGHHNPRSMMTETEKLSQTIHSVTPTPIPLNQKIGAVPQIFATGDMPKVEGLTTSRGASVGIVAQEAAKWHTMMGVLSMQTKTEVAALKKEIAQTGTVSAEFMQSYSQLLPSMEAVTQNAAEASALIVKQVQAGELNVQQGRAAIMAENAKLETLMAQATQQVAADLGRTANLTTVPLINQPIVSSTGKSNIKELFKKGRGSKTIIDKIASALGVKTWGGGYSTETTMPKRLATGSLVPGTGNQDTVPAMLTPGEFVVNAGATRANLPLLQAINGAGSNGPGYNTGSSGAVDFAPMSPTTVPRMSGVTNQEMSSLFPERFAGGKGSYRLRGTAGVYLNEITDPSILKKYPELVKNGKISKSKLNLELAGNGLPTEVYKAAMAASKHQHVGSTDQFLSALSKSGIINEKDAVGLQKEIDSLYLRHLNNSAKVKDASNPYWAASNTVIKRHLFNNSDALGFWDKFSSEPAYAVSENLRSSGEPMRSPSMELRSITHNGKTITLDPLKAKKIQGFFAHTATPAPLLKRLFNAGITALENRRTPHIFRNKGGIIPGGNIPHYANGGRVLGSNTSNYGVGGMVKSLALPIGMQMLAPSIGSKIGSAVGGQTGASVGSGIGQVAAFAAMFMGFGNSANKAEGSVGKLAGTVRKLTGFIANLNPYVKGITLTITAALVIWNKLHAAQKESDRLNRLAFAGGIKPIKDFDSQIKEIRKNIVAANQAREAFLATKTSAGVSGIQITVKELKDLQVEMKKSYPEIIKMLNQTSMAGLKDTAAGLKAQFIQAGDAADVANKKVLALLTSSNKASNVGTALSSSSFNSMNDLAGANKFSLNNLSKAQSLGNAGFVGQLLQTFTGLDAAVSNSKDKISGVSKQFEAINSSQSKNLKLTKDQLKELSKTNPQLSSILSTSDSIGDAYAKWRIILSGVSKDLSGLTSGELQNLAKYTSEVSGYFNSLSDVSSKAAQSGIFGGLAKQIDTLNKASATSSKISSSIQTSLQDQIKLKQKQIQQIQDEASARKKALQDQQTIEDTKLQIQQEQLNYQNALTSGDMASAAQAQLAIQKLVGQQQLNTASDAIDKMAQSKVDKLQAEIEKLQAKSDTTTTTASNTSTTQTNAATKLKALYDELNQLTQSIDLHGGSATEGDTIAFNDIIERLKKAGASASVLKQLNPSGGGSTYSGGGMKPTLNATQDLQSLAAQSNDQVIKNTGQTVKELVAIQTILKNRSDIGTGSGTKADPFTVAPVGASSKGRSLISAANLNKDGTLTARGITDVIITNKLKKGQYFNYAGKTYQVDYGDGAMTKPFSTIDDAHVVTRASGGAIFGSGTATSDSIPAMLSHGEYVVNAASASKFGYTNLDQINKMAAGGVATKYDIPKMAFGGKVNTGNMGMANNSNSLYNINVNVNGSNADAKDIAYAIRKEMQLRDAMNGRDRTK